MTSTVPVRRRARPADPKRSAGRPDWARWPTYDAAATGLREYWYPAAWSSQVSRQPIAVEVCTERIVLQRDVDGAAYALHDRCPHRGVRLSQGRQEFPGTITCPYHAWTYRLSDGELVAIITDGPDSPMCGKVAVMTYPVDEALGLVWVYIGDGEPHPLTAQLPEELVDAPPMAVGGRIEDRDGNWRYYAENGFDEGHAKYLHRTSYWRTFKTMPTWNKVHIERHGRWIYRIEDERHWEARSPGSARGPTTGGGSASRRSPRASRSATRARGSTRSVHRRPGLPGVRLAGRARGCCASPTRASSTTSSTCRSTPSGRSTSA